MVDFCQTEANRLRIDAAAAAFVQQKSLAVRRGIAGIKFCELISFAALLASSGLIQLRQLCVYADCLDKPRCTVARRFFPAIGDQSRTTETICCSLVINDCSTESDWLYSELVRIF